MLLAAGGCSLVLGFDKDYHAQGSGGAGGADHASSSTSTGTSTGGTSSTTTTGTGTGGAGGASTTTGTGAGGAGCQPGEGTVLALTKLDFGDGNNGQWKKVGFDIDGLTSTGASVDLCQPNSGGAPGAAYPDGDSGIDNSFGKNFLPQLLAIYPDWVMDVNGGLQSGDFNLLMKMYCLPPAGDVPTLTTKLFGGTALGKAPKYDGTDPWPVAPEHLSNPLDPESSTIVFGQSSVMGTTFDSAKKVSFILTIPMSASGMDIVLPNISRGDSVSPI